MDLNVWIVLTSSFLFSSYWGIICSTNYPYIALSMIGSNRVHIDKYIYRVHLVTSYANYILNRFVSVQKNMLHLLTYN